MHDDEYDWDPDEDDIWVVGADAPIRAVDLQYRAREWHITATETAGPDYHRPGYTEQISSAFSVSTSDVEEARETVHEFIQQLTPQIPPSHLVSVLCRADLKRGQITLLKMLHEHDDPIPREDLATKLRAGIHEDTGRSLNGVLGAFANRINATDEIPGRPGIDAFIKRRRIDGELHYQLRYEAQEAIRKVPALVRTFDEPWDELLEPDTRLEKSDLVPASE
ncbi:MAG: hypothetical protein ABEH88_05265 [Halobacteriales archaeon]